MQNALVKVCCISSLVEANMALEAGADFLGLVSEMPSGPGVISLAEIASIVAALPVHTKTILLSSKRNFQDVLSQHNMVKTWGIQLVDKLPKSDLDKLRKALPETHLIQVVHVRDKSSIPEALSYVNPVDTILLDSGNPHAKVKTLGGTGEIHDWNISREICEKSSVPVLLAGGLNPDNILAAMNGVHPDGFDLCSGVRTNGKLDHQKLKIFMHRLHHN